MLTPSFDFAQDIRKKPFVLSRELVERSKDESRETRDSGQAYRNMNGAVNHPSRASG